MVYETERIKIDEGKILNSIIYTRLIKQNKNFICGIFGKTGSGKSYVCLRIAELWYKRKFREEFPISNVCFSAEELLNRLQKPIRRGELIIFEEAGVSMGSLDFQNKIAKAMNYVLQSFRSMNICLLLNLPYFSMLNKQTRMLMHMRIMTHDIDKSRQEAIVKPQWLSYSQDRTEPYHPRIQVMINGFWDKVDFLHYKHPTQELADQYEEVKKKFLSKTIKEAHTTIQGKKKVQAKIRSLTEKELRVHQLVNVKGLTQTKVGEIMGVSSSRISKMIKNIQKKSVIPNKIT